MINHNWQHVAGTSFTCCSQCGLMVSVPTAWVCPKCHVIDCKHAPPFMRECKWKPPPGFGGCRSGK